MPSLVVVGRTEIEARIAGLSHMPADADGAVQRLKAQVQRAWASLDGETGAQMVCSAIHATMPLLPSLRHTQATSLEELLDSLDSFLSNHHPEEIRVASYTMLKTLLEVVWREQGDRGVHELLAALEGAGS